MTRKTSASPIAVTSAIAMAAGRDAGDRSMRAAGRHAWNADDWNAAAAAARRLLGLASPETASPETASPETASLETASLEIAA